MSTSACAPGLGPAELYPRLQSFVRGVLGALGTAPADVDDLTQDVFVTMHRKGCTFDHERAARAWLYAAARRIASNDRRARRRAARREPGWLAAEPLSPEAQVQRRQAARRVRRFADELEAPLREVFVRSELGGASAPEIADDLGLNLNTTYSHIRRIRRRLARSGVRRRRWSRSD
jgi:RNA polymerase sigma-70 factor (ECF subfamily)